MRIQDLVFVGLNGRVAALEGTARKRKRAAGGAPKRQRAARA